jgi:hypothetical protein
MAFGDLNKVFGQVVPSGAGATGGSTNPGSLSSTTAEGDAFKAQLNQEDKIAGQLSAIRSTEKSINGKFYTAN